MERIAFGELCDYYMPFKKRNNHKREGNMQLCGLDIGERSTLYGTDYQGMKKF